MIESQRDAGPPPRVWPSGRWWAPFYLFDDALGIPFASGGAGHAGGAPAADEYATIEGLRAHMRESVAFVHPFAAGAERHELVFARGIPDREGLQCGLNRSSLESSPGPR